MNTDTDANIKALVMVTHYYNQLNEIDKKTINKVLTINDASELNDLLDQPEMLYVVLDILIDSYAKCKRNNRK